MQDLPHLLVQADGLQVTHWSYGKVQPQGWSPDPRGPGIIGHRQELRVHWRRTEWRSNGLPPNLTSRFTPGTLISSYEVYEALRRGVAVPFRKQDAEGIRNISDLRASDKGGMIFQPEPGVYKAIYRLIKI